MFHGDHQSKIIIILEFKNIATNRFYWKLRVNMAEIHVDVITFNALDKNNSISANKTIIKGSNYLMCYITFKQKYAFL